MYEQFIDVEGKAEPVQTVLRVILIPNAWGAKSGGSGIRYAVAEGVQSTSIDLAPRYVMAKPA